MSAESVGQDPDVEERSEVEREEQRRRDRPPRRPSATGVAACPGKPEGEREKEERRYTEHVSLLDPEREPRRVDPDLDDEEHERRRRDGEECALGRRVVPTERSEPDEHDQRADRDHADRERNLGEVVDDPVERVRRSYSTWSTPPYAPSPVSSPAP